MNVEIQRVMGYRQWCNKLWKPVRFSLSKHGDDYVPPTNVNPNDLPFSCQWILSVLNKVIFKTIASLDSYKFLDAASTVYSQWQYQLCDVFIEEIKPFFAGSDPRFDTDRIFARDTLWLCLDNGQQLLHHFMPYVTEELWKRLPSSRVQTNKRALGALILTVPFPANVGLALHEFYIKNFPYRAPKTLHVHQYLEGVSGVATQIRSKNYMYSVRSMISVPLLDNMLACRFLRFLLMKLGYAVLNLPKRSLRLNLA